ncbi:MAG: hypothetical protein MI923_17575 [Phycisphaerales bacterium]|nr:hypothetical protein [Phycisphaerales bacterium]
MPEAARKIFDALCVVSPYCLGNEEKNQDRVGWYPAVGVASLGDGVTTSARSGEAAETAVNLSPILRRNAREGIKAISDLLFTRRLEAQHAPIQLPEHASSTMRPMLEHAAREQLSKSFQTTLVSLCLTPGDENVVVDGVVCGDSAFFVFDADGTLLASSLACDIPVGDSDDADTMRVCLGDELLIKIVSHLSEHPGLADKAEIRSQHIDRWFVCKVLDKCNNNGSKKRQGAGSIVLKKDEPILVPGYLVGQYLSPNSGHYPKIWFSETIRLLSTPPPTTSFNSPGSATAVLPDQVDSKLWREYREQFPLDSHFVLGSDGFYGSFDSPSELWAWLQRHETQLRNQQQASVMKALHTQLHAKRNDDDISFVWVYPMNREAR